MNRFLKYADLEKRFGISRATIDRRIRAGELPPPIPGTGAKQWSSLVIDLYEEGLHQGLHPKLATERAVTVMQGGIGEVARSAPVPPLHRQQDEIEAKLAIVARELSRTIEVNVDEKAIAENIDYEKLANALLDAEAEREVKRLAGNYDILLAAIDEYLVEGL